MVKGLLCHSLPAPEVEELFNGEPKFRFVENGLRKGDYAALGQTDGGRYLITFFIMKADNRALPLSARDMTQAERRRYVRK